MAQLPSRTRRGLRAERKARTRQAGRTTVVWKI
jgi:hypothetical protein